MAINHRNINPEQKISPPEFRRATEQDFDALYDIWMQDHINPFMSFERMPRKQFKKTVFPKLIGNGSQVYVLVVNGEIAAVRQLIYGTGEREHIAEFNSFGVHKAHLRRGHGETIFSYLLNTIERENPKITCIEISQEMDNDIALHLAEKIGFRVEAKFPDWFYRNKDKRQQEWPIGERFLRRTIKPTPVSALSIPMYTAQLPELKSSYNRPVGQSIVKHHNTLFYQQGKETLAVCELDPGIWRYSHIEFLQSVRSTSICNADALQNFLRMVITEEARQFKKIEIFTHDRAVSHAIAALGFHCRGKTTGSYKNIALATFHDEIAADISFFNIDDAIEFIENHAKDHADNKKIDIINKLIACETVIAALQEQNKIDRYGYLYLQNLAFQMVTDTLGKTPYYTKENGPWEKLVRQLPLSLANHFSGLARSLDLSYKTTERISEMAGLLFSYKNATEKKPAPLTDEIQTCRLTRSHT